MKQGFRLAVASVVLLVLGGCGAPGGTPGGADTSMELKIYDVPAAQTAQLGGALGNALGKKASVTMPAPGRLLVYAPRDAQASIGAALASLGQKNSAQQTDTPVALHFWIVDALTGAGADDKGLEPLATTLDAVRHAVGPMHFRLEQAASSLAASDRHGRLVMSTTGGSRRTFDFSLGAATENGVELSLDYQDGGTAGLRQFSTQVGARFGEYLVLAQAPGACQAILPPGQPASSCPRAAPTLQLLIVRVDRKNTRT